MIDVLDRESCGQPFVPPGLSREYPYVCAVLVVADHVHVHFAQTCAWPRQPPPSSDDYTEEWASLDPVQECLS